MSHEPGIIRFGVFEVHLATGELRRNGSRVKLQEQPFQVLVALLERQGEVVTKEELKERLWAGDTFVDFDHSLSTAVNKIREALGDSASNPRFVETVPRRGYRFIGIGAKESVGAIESPTAGPEGSSSRRDSPRTRMLAWVMAVAALVALATFGFSRWRSEAPPALVFSDPRPLTSLPGREQAPALSPDGTRVAYSWSEGVGDSEDIYVQVVGSSNRLQLTTDPARDLAPAWSPDGRQIAFMRHSASGRMIYLTSPLGGPETKVADVPEYSGGLTGITWGPDGKSIFYSAPDREGGPTSIRRVLLETGEKERLTYPAADLSQGRDELPTVSPDGRTLAFTRGAGASPTEIWLAPLGGGEPRKLTSQGQRIFGHAWTPDSREIVYSRALSAQDGRLWRVSVETGESRLLANIAGYAWFPTVAAQGKVLAYQSYDYDTDIWAYPLPQAGNEELPRLVAPSTYGDSDAQISPNGRQIVFNSGRSGSLEIWVCDRDGSNLRQLTSLGARSGSPRWSHDGRRIVFDSSLPGNWDIYVVDAQGGVPRRLTTHSGMDVRPSWSADGERIYFSSDRSGRQQIWKIPPEGGEAVEVTTGPHDSQAFESPDGRFLYFQRLGESREIWRKPVEGGQEVATGLAFPFPDGWGVWDVAKNGIYFIEPRETAVSTTKWFLRLLGHDLSEPSDVMEVAPTMGAATPLDIAPDGQWFVQTQSEQVNIDLMVVENFE